MYVQTTYIYLCDVYVIYIYLYYYDKCLLSVGSGEKCTLHSDPLHFYSAYMCDFPGVGNTNWLRLLIKRLSLRKQPGWHGY